MTTEYERLGGKLPEAIEDLVKEYAQPRLKKPKHCKIMKDCIYYDTKNRWPWTQPWENPTTTIPAHGGTEIQLMVLEAFNQMNDADDAQWLSIENYVNTNY